MLKIWTFLKYGDYEYATINSVVNKNFDSRFEVICLKILHHYLQPFSSVAFSLTFWQFWDCSENGQRQLMKKFSMSQANQKWIENKSSLKTVKMLVKKIYCFWDKISSKGYYFMVLMFLTNWNLIFILVNFFHFLPISWATWFCNVWLLTSHWEKNKSIYAVSLNQAKHCRKHQKSWGQPKSWEVVLPNQLSRIHNHRT